MRILVVEDQKPLADSLTEGLKQEHFAVDVFYDGISAFEVASTEEYDCILLDRMLPGMDGVTFCQKLRNIDVQTPILMLTAKDTTADKITGLDSGADDYLIKPFAFDEVLARIRALVRRTMKEKQTILTLDSLVLDTTAHTVQRTNKNISLTGKEYALLEYFMYHKGNILTREQILSHVWDFSYDSFSNIVDVMVRRLRKKIDEDFSKEKPLFATIRGLGYKLG